MGHWALNSSKRDGFIIAFLKEKDNKAITLPTELNLCANFVQLGKSCKNDKQGCPNGRHITLHRLSQEEKDKVTAFVTATDGVEFVKR